MPSFIRLKNQDREKLFSLIKRNINSSWENFYPQFNISRTMFFNYLTGRYAIPKNLFFLLEKIAAIKINDYKQIERDKYIKKEIVKPRMNSSLAEIFGILNGDGHISKFKHEICVVGDIREKNYCSYLKTLFQGAFGVSFTIYEADSYFKLRVYSIDISNFLTKTYGLPKGNKLGKLKIPEKVLTSKKWTISYIRGLFDTDGSFFIRRKKDPVIEISSADPIFLLEVKTALTSLDFNVAKGNKRIFIYQKEDIRRFFKVIKPANSKHLKKYQNYLKIGARVI